MDRLLPSNEYENLQDKSEIVCLRNFLNTSAFLDQLQSLDKNYHQKAKDLYSKFSNYEVPVVTIRRKKEDVGIIFERINNTGTKMNMVDIMVAWTWSDDFQLKGAISELTDILEEKGFGSVPTKIILQSISGIVQDTTKSKQILNLDPSIIRQNFERLIQSLLKSVDFLYSEFNCNNSDFLPHVQQIVGLSKFFSLQPFPSAEKLDKIKKWFWLTSFSRRYAGQTDDKMDADIKCINFISQDNYTLLEEYSHELDPKSLISTKFSKGHPYARAFLLLMAMGNPLDLVKGIRIDVGNSLSEFNRRQYHHVFPQAFLKLRGLQAERINSVVNFCFLPSDSNKKISNKSPSNYFFDVVPQSKYQEILKSNFLPLNKAIYKDNDYERFLHERVTLIIQKVDELTVD
jgi:hypothetical protein